MLVVKDVWIGSGRAVPPHHAIKPHQLKHTHHSYQYGKLQEYISRIYNSPILERYVLKVRSPFHIDQSMYVHVYAIRTHAACPAECPPPS